jgi:hypothetical protein
MQENLAQAPASFGQAITDYLDENQAELFETRDACVEWAKENYDALISGDLGGNLLSKYAMLSTPFAESLEDAPIWSTWYDIEAWRDGDFDGSLESFRFSSPRDFATRVDPRVKSVLLKRLDTFGEHPTGLGRFTRTMFAQDFRREIISQ